MKPTIYLPSAVARLVLSRCRLIRATSSLPSLDPLTSSSSVSASCG